MGGKIRTSCHQTYFVFVTLFSKPTLTKQKYIISENVSQKDGRNKDEIRL